jgi:hypothetical protein
VLWPATPRTTSLSSTDPSLSRRNTLVFSGSVKDIESLQLIASMAPARVTRTTPKTRRVPHLAVEVAQRGVAFPYNSRSPPPLRITSRYQRIGSFTSQPPVDRLLCKDTQRIPYTCRQCHQSRPRKTSFCPLLLLEYCWSGNHMSLAPAHNYRTVCLHVVFFNIST